MIDALTSFGKYKITLSVLFISLIVSQIGFAQDLPPMPAVCTNPPPGYLIGGNFMVPIGCSDPNTGKDSILMTASNITDGLGDMSSVWYYFGLTNGIDITASDFNPVKGERNSGVLKGSQMMGIGAFWVLQIGEKAGQKYLKCASGAVRDRSAPDAKIYTCDGSTVKIEIPDSPKNQHDRYKIDWGNGFVEDVLVNGSNPLPIEKERTYTGTLAQVSITGFYKTDNFCSTYPTLKNPSSPEIPFLNMLKFAADGTSVELGYKDFTAGKEYEVEYAEDNGSNPNWVSGGKTSNGIFQMGGLKVAKKYCFRLKLVTECGDFEYSQSICSLAADSRLNSSSDVTVFWEFPANPSGIPQNLQLVRTTVGCSTCPKENMPLYSNADQEFRDVSITCSEKYTYQVVARYAVTNNGRTEFITITSGEVKVNPMDASAKIIPDGIINVGYLQNDDSMVRLVIFSDAEISQYQFHHKSPGESAFTQIGKGPQDSFEDISVKPSQGSYCYKYSVEDACGVTSDLSPEFCTVFLSHEGNVLKWTDYSFPKNMLTNGPASYTVQMFDASVNAFIAIYRTSDLQQAIGRFLVESQEPELKFRILAEQFLNLPGYTNFSFPSFSNTITIPVPVDVFVPSAFSPNKDGANDKFVIFSRMVRDASITIFDRWGGVVFEGIVGGDGWDGTDGSGSRQLPGGSYTYRIQGISQTGHEFSKTGTITLLR